MTAEADNSDSPRLHDGIRALRNYLRSHSDIQGLPPVFKQGRLRAF